MCCFAEWLVFKPLMAPKYMRSGITRQRHCPPPVPQDPTPTFRAPLPHRSARLRWWARPQGLRSSSPLPDIRLLRYKNTFICGTITTLLFKQTVFEKYIKNNYLLAVLINLLWLNPIPLIQIIVQRCITVLRKHILEMCMPIIPKVSNKKSSYSFCWCERGWCSYPSGILTT